MTIKTKHATAEYRDGYDRIFSKPQPSSKEEFNKSLLEGALVHAKTLPNPFEQDRDELERIFNSPKAPE